MFGFRRRSEPSATPHAEVLPMTKVKKDLDAYLSKVQDIGKRRKRQVLELALQTVAGQGKLDVFCTSLLRMDIVGMTRPRAIELALFLHGRAHAIIERERRTSMGIKHATWRYSGAGCFNNPTNPAQMKQDAAHRAAHGKRYDNIKGLLINGKRTWPGMDEGCKCISISEIPGLSVLG